MAEEDPERPLNYASPDPDTVGTPAQVALTIAGFACGIVGTVILGFMLGVSLPSYSAPAARITIGIMLLAGCAACCFFAGRQTSKGTQRYLAIGFLIGTAIASLIEGICFINM